MQQDSSGTQATSEGTAAVDRAAYLAFSRTWAASARMSPLSQEEVQQRTVELFRLLCRRVSPALALELGAHEASFSRWAAGHLDGARVLAVEANPHVHEKYAEAVAAAGVDYRNLAVAPVTGDVELHLPLQVGRKKRALTSRMASLAVHTQATDSVQVTVPGVRLDDLVTLGAADRAVAWIDVEGANQAVLESGPEVLAHLDALYIEVELEPRWEGQWLDTDVARHLRRHAMVPLARDLSPRDHQYNVVYVSTELAQDPEVAREAAKVLRRRPFAG